MTWEWGASTLWRGCSPGVDSINWLSFISSRWYPASVEPEQASLSPLLGSAWDHNYMSDVCFENADERTLPWGMEHPEKKEKNTHTRKKNPGPS